MPFQTPSKCVATLPLPLSHHFPTQTCTVAWVFFLILRIMYFVACFPPPLNCMFSFFFRRFYLIIYF